jgi:Novel STAND NTPase 1
MSDVPDRETARFDVVCVPIGDYQWYPSLEADAEAARLAALLATVGGRAEQWDIADSEPRTATAVYQRLGTWSQPERARNSILIWVGHGQANPDGAWLASHETPIAMEAGGIIPEQLAGFITAEWRRRVGDDDAWAIVVIEACGAERFVNLLHSVLLRGVQPPHRFVVIGVGAPDGAGNLGDFRQALDDALTNGYNDGDDTIGLLDLLGQVEQRLESGTVHRNKLYRPQPLPRRRLLPTAVTAPMDTYAEMREVAAALPPDQRAHFLPKAQGADHLEYGEPAWYFVGRESERAAIARWLREQPAGLLVVTGRPGSGKSALLGHVLVHATPRLRDLLIHMGRMAPAPDGEFPDDLRFDAVIHLAGLSLGEVVRRVAAAAGIGDPPATGTPSEDVEWMLNGFARRSRPFTAMVDALDESLEPAAVASAVLRRLPTAGRVRVIVGTRASAMERSDRPAPDRTDLLDALGSDTTILVVPRDPAAIRRYITMRLAAARAAGQLTADDATIAALAGLVQERDQDFLYARMAVHEVIANPALLHLDQAS